MTAVDPSLHFPAQARAVVRSLRGSFSDVVAAAGADPNDHQSISRALGLNKNLAWKISKIINADDPAAALEQMPGAAGIKIFLTSVEQAGIDAATVQAARDAVESYERLITVHSGDRATLEMMGNELSPGRQQRNEHHRKLLFQGASYVWGAQARVNLKVGIVGPGAEPGLLDFASINGLIDFRRIRADVAWVMASRQSRNDDGTDMKTSASEPLDSASAGPDRAPLMTEFCSRPLPELRRVITGRITSFELVEGPVGNTGALTCIFGAIQRRIPFYRTPANEFGEHSAMCDIPAELLILDVFFHEQFTFAKPQPFLYSELGAQVPYPARGRDRFRLPLNEPLQDLGMSPLPLTTPEVPRYNQMLAAAFKRMEWNPAHFFGFRMKIAYPACPTALVLRYPLPAAP